MISWGVKVNDYGNAILDENGEFIKVSENGVSDPLWNKMVEYAKSKGVKGGNYKKLNLPFENRMMGQSKEYRDRMAKAVNDFVYNMLCNVFNARDTAPLAIEAIIKAGSYSPGPKAERIDDPAEWTRKKILERALSMNADKGPKGNFDD